MILFAEIKNACKNYPFKSIAGNFFSWLISDAYIVSFRKSGRTWLRIMIAKAISLQYDIPKIQLDTQYMSLFTSAPNIVFSHGGSNKPNNGINFRRWLKGKKLILLVRDPRDDIVSLYHDYTVRHPKISMSISGFVRHEQLGINYTLNYMNEWATELEKRKNPALLIRYEDLKQDAQRELIRALDFLQIPHTTEIIKKAVEFGSFENMRKMELSNQFKDSRLQTSNKSDANAFKTRKGRAGSYKEELCPEDILFVNKEMNTRLNPVFRYYF